MNMSLPMTVSDQVPSLEPWPFSQSHVMEENVAYLRIKGWNEDAFNEVAAWMPRFAAARGLIVDIRGNRGGTRNVLRELYPYFVDHADNPHIAGAAKYRLCSAFQSDHLSGRNMFPLTWDGWTSAESLSITEFMQTFEPGIACACLEIGLPLALGFAGCQVDSILGATLERQGKINKHSNNVLSIFLMIVCAWIILIALA